MTRPLSESSPSKDVGRLHWRTNQLERRPIAPAELGVAIEEIKVFEDIVAVVVGDDAFIW